MMRVVSLAWYISGLSALLAFMISAITFAPPGPGLIMELLPFFFLVLSLFAAILANRLGRLPPCHRLLRSRSLKAVLTVVAVTVTLMVVVIV